MKVAIAVLILLAGAFIAYYIYTSLWVATPEKNPNFTNQVQNSSMKLTSPAFEDSASIPQKFTCDGANINPELYISDVPDGAKSLVLIMDDPDATGGITWDHWVVWNIDPKTSVIAENSLPVGAIQGMTSFGDQKYGGPCPPRGSKPHRYMFKLYALDAILAVDERSAKKEIETAMRGHILAETQFIGMYGR
ncbi:MAG: Phospholipid-binding protein, PBP family [Parcubacteria group bacterium GW2011_GWA1_47_9]|nr:MAG: Phospholipid-binding protein, PBP family [Parcubacteria group bacterium GW2011_GWA1_47_9]